MGGGWLCFIGLTSLQICALPALLSKGVAPPATSRCSERSEEKTQGTAQCKSSFLMKEHFSGSFALRKSRAKAAQKLWLCLSGVIQEHFYCLASASYGKILLLWHRGPLYPGAQSQVPSSGEQDPPFSQLQEMEQLGPQRPWVQMLSQWMPKDTKPHVRLPTTFTLLIDQRNARQDWCLTVPHRANGGVWEGNSSSFICLIKWKLRKCQRGEFCRC